MEQLVSIIIPAFNEGSYLEECIKSLVIQEYKEWEAIIVDDGSNDHTSEICEAWVQQDKRIRYIKQQTQGQPSARNTGMALAKGAFIQFLDADDIIQPKKLQTQVSFLETNRSIDITFSNVYYFKTNKTEKHELFLNRWEDPNKPWITKIEGSGEKLVNAYARKNLFELGCALFRRNVITRTGKFDVTLSGVEDYDFCWRAAIYGFRFCYAREENAEVEMRHHEAGLRKSIRSMHQAEINLRNKITISLKSCGFKDAMVVNKKQMTARLRKWQYLTIAEYRSAKYKPSSKDFFWYCGKTNLFESMAVIAKLLKNIPKHIDSAAKSSSRSVPQKHHSYFPAENDV